MTHCAILLSAKVQIPHDLAVDDFVEGHGRVQARGGLDPDQAGVAEPGVHTGNYVQALDEERPCGPAHAHAQGPAVRQREYVQIQEQVLDRDHVVVAVGVVLMVPLVQL